MKDFAQEYLNTKSLPPNTDPYLYTTPEVREELLEMQGIAFSSFNTAHIIALLITSPLTTITASLQLSVKPHKTIYEEPTARGTQVAKINTSLTLQQKRKMELMLRSGGQQKPYTAPVYEGYRATIKGLAAQGWQAFFKGLLFRSIHQLGHYYAFYEIGLMESNETGFREVTSMATQLIKMWLLQCACDSSLNMFYIAQNRYILQNNISQFRVFRNASRVIRKMIMRKEVFTGLPYHFINCFLDVFVKYPLYLSVTKQLQPLHLGFLYLSELFIYPLNTAFRRLTCQHPDIPGMIPLRYAGLFHAVRLIATQEGLLGLYKGFGLHHLTMAIRLSCIVFAGPLLRKSMPLE